MTFGLKDLVFVNRATLADGTVHWANPGTGCHRAGTVLQWAREKFVEAFVMCGIRVNRLVHVDLVALHKALDHPRGETAPFGTGQAAR